MLLDGLSHRTNQIKDQQLYRERISLRYDQNLSNIIYQQENKLINFSSNDYLGLAQLQSIKQAAIEGLNKYGIGAGSSAFVAGYSEVHEALEHAFASWLGVDRALVFNSGYMANIGVLSAMLNRHALVYSDKLCHASLLDGVKLSQAKHQRYQHLSIAHLKMLCEKRIPDLIMTESVFSMNGDIAPITKLVELAATSLLIDDAHGIGVLGHHGKGAIEAYHLSQNDFLCITMPLGKAFGVMGSVVAGRAEVIDAIIQLSGPCRYTTALSPTICYTLMHILQIINNGVVLRERLNHLINYFIKKAKSFNLQLCSLDITPIKPILIGDVDKAIRIQNKLKEKGFYVYAIRPPTVPVNTARLRVSINALHTESMIDELLTHIATFMDE